VALTRPNCSAGAFARVSRKPIFSQKTTQVLLEQSRFLLDEIKPGSLKIGSHSLAFVINEVAACLAPYAEQRRIEVKIRNLIQPDADSVQMDRELVDMMVFNLVDNAIKYSHRERSVELVLYLERGYWVLLVTDIGVHIKDQDRKSIFERFERRPTGQHATTRPGTGLGLPVAKEIAEAHSGTIAVESRLLQKSPEPVAETCFTVKIPRRI
jgi:signal transduction histidine kinase